MKPIEKKIIKILSIPHLNLKKNYKIYRKVISFFNPPIKCEYRTLDYKMEVEGREIPVRIFLPKESQTAKVLIFFHGGGWVTGDIDSYTNVCRNMADNTEHIVVSVDYRLAPENPFPKGVEDCYYVTQEIFKRPDLLNCKKEDITLIGDSAGGNLAAVVSLMGRDREAFYPKRQILIYPATNYDHSEASPYASVRENGKDYLMTSKRIQDYLDLYVENEADKLNPYVAPILSTDLKNQPDTLIITAGYDPLRDEGEAYGYKLQEFGNNVKMHRVEDAIHGFFSMPINTEGQSKTYQWINSFLNDTKD
ncbi:MAG TPA: alpha/beta hydrolase [Epulopiscium sp.]|nr:alpha/beta hydrolase [Candidatus Epulonipiscium sp.]